jgi:hypothetical protein
MISKDTLHQLIDGLSETQVDRAWQLLQPLRPDTDPLVRALLEAPDDDEPLTLEDLTAIGEADADVANGNVVPWEEVRMRIEQSNW